MKVMPQLLDFEKQFQADATRLLRLKATYRSQLVEVIKQAGRWMHVTDQQIDECAEQKFAPRDQEEIRRIYSGIFGKVKRSSPGLTDDMVHVYALDQYKRMRKLIPMSDDFS